MQPAQGLTEQFLVEAMVGGLPAEPVEDASVALLEDPRTQPRDLAFAHPQYLRIPAIPATNLGRYPASVSDHYPPPSRA